MIGDERENLRVNAWIRGGKKNGLFVRPRLFMPYYEEIKVNLELFAFFVCTNSSFRANNKNNEPNEKC